MLEIASGGVSWARVRVARVLSTLGKACFAIGLSSIYVLSAIAGHERVEGAVLASMGAAWVAMLACIVASYIVWFARSSAPAKVLLDDESLVVASARRSRTVLRSRIASAYAVSRPVGGGWAPSVEIVLSHGDVITARVATPEDARALVSALGFGQGGRRVTIALDAPARRLYDVLLGVGAYQLGSIAMVPFVALARVLAGTTMHGEIGALAGALVGPAALGVYTLLKRLVRPPTMTIGDDGIAYSAGLTKRFVARGAVTSIEQVHPSAPLVVHTAAAPPLVVNASVLDHGKRAAAAQVAYERLVASPRGPDAPAAFQRVGGSVAEWRAHLRGLFDAGGYRTAGTSVDDAAAVLRTPTASPEQRIGAALALRVAGEPPERIRVAAEAAADDRVRDALEAVASGDDTAAEKAVRRLFAARLSR